MQHFSEADQALLDLSRQLVADGYRHVTPTPETHGRVLARSPDRRAGSLTDVFGWSVPFESGAIPRAIEEALREVGMLDETGAALRSMVRLSTVRDVAFWHSAYPTAGTDAVFLGPDSYRFANLIADELERQPLPAGGRIVDIGVGAGVGAVTAAALCPGATVVATDINGHALRLARINAAAAGFAIETIETSGLDDVPAPFDLALLNPPYLMDDDSRAYRDGGGMHGAQLPFDLTLAALGKLSGTGRAILYTGSAILDGQDPLKARLVQAAGDHGCTLRYREIDPDVFGEELDRPQYAEVERIALVSAVFTRT
ncbi:methyltransferase [Sphingomonas arantia]|uniref:Methyltransferase n=1 Tax=Sphingomonas arantia TaxID=1460676 RepID=A0ABW4U2L6_9SPHN